MVPLRTLPLAALILGLGACLAGPEVAEPDIRSTTFHASLGVDIPASTELPGGTFYRDLSVGAGEVAASGHTVTVRYTGWLANGTKFDETAAGAPGIQFQLGAAQVIAGWDAGLPGMRVGGLRQLIIPPSQGYGRNGFGPIPGNSILVFNVYLTAIAAP